MPIKQYDTLQYTISKYIDLLFNLVNFCQFASCSNGGICRQTNTPLCFTCDCPVGFTGTLCEIKQNTTATSKSI